MKPEYVIPQDVWETAEAFAMKMRLTGYTSQHTAPIARAIMAERERAAGIAEIEAERQIDAVKLSSGRQPGTTLAEEKAAMAKRIATAIRTAEPNPVPGI